MIQNNRPKTIQIYLPFGNPSGIRAAETTINSNIRLIEIPRAEIDAFGRLKEADEMGIYFLLDEPLNASKPKLYIGQTRDLGKRLKQHEEKKRFWSRAFAVVLKNNFRTLDHLYHLEKMSIERAVAAGACVLDNANSGSQNRHMHDSIRWDCEDIFKEIDMLMAIFNQPVFAHIKSLLTQPDVAETINGLLENKTDKFSDFAGDKEQIAVFCRSKDKAIRGKGYFIVSTKQIILLKDSMIRKQVSATLPIGWLKNRQKWLENGDLSDSNSDSKYYVLQSDKLCDTPSMAAALVFGNNRNGWQYWRTIEGKTLDIVFRSK